MSIGLITVAYGEMYRNLLPEWVNAVNSLSTAPEIISIVTDNLVDATMKAFELEHPFITIQADDTHKHHPQVYANQAIEAIDTTWICRMDVDDKIYPHAFNELEQCETDVYCFGISINGERNLHPQNVTASEILKSSHNLLFAGSPFRREAWKNTMGYQDMLYDDWRFWRDLAETGATFTPSGTIDYEYRWNENSSTFGIDHKMEARRVLT